MGLSGKYDFKGIKEKGALGLKLALSASPYTAWMLKLGKLLDLILEFFSNWLANKGLMILNIGAFYVAGEIDQKLLDAALDNAFEQIKKADGKLTAEQMKAIDDEVIKAARRALPYTKSI